MGGGAWPFLVRGVICLVNSDNERDSNFLNRCRQGYDVESYMHSILCFVIKVVSAIFMVEYGAVVL